MRNADFGKRGAVGRLLVGRVAELVDQIDEFEESGLGNRPVAVGPLLDGPLSHAEAACDFGLGAKELYCHA
jgi:hypothetical protein